MTTIESKEGKIKKEGEMKTMLLENRKIVHVIVEDDGYNIYSRCGVSGSKLTTSINPDSDYYHAYTGEKADWHFCKRCEKLMYKRQ